MFRLLIICFIIITIISCSKKEKIKESPIIPMEQIEFKDLDSEKQKEEKNVYIPKGRDPFIPLLKQDKEIEIEQLKLVGFLWNNKEKLIVVETKDEGRGYVLRKGEVLGKYRLVAIEKDIVWLEQIKGGPKERYKLELFREEEE